MEELFEKYFSGTISSEQEQELWSFIKASSENEAEFRKADRRWDENPKISHKLQMQFSLLEKRAAANRQKSVSRRIAWISAAASCILIATGLSTWSFFKTDEATICSAHETKDVILPDGSVVNMNKESTLSYSFARRSREVFLDGEAFFDVKHDEKKPFTVQSGKCHVTVLGTKFNVTDYSSDSNAQVILADGSLRLDLNGEENILENGDKVFFDGEKIKKSKVDSKEADIWKSGAIVFESISLDDFVKRVSREYGVKVELAARGFARNTFRASFIREESVDNILESICQVFPLYIDKADGIYYLKFTTNN